MPNCATNPDSFPARHPPPPAPPPGQVAESKAPSPARAFSGKASFSPIPVPWAQPSDASGLSEEPHRGAARRFGERGKRPERGCACPGGAAHRLGEEPGAAVSAPAVGARLLGLRRRFRFGGLLRSHGQILGSPVSGESLPPRRRGTPRVGRARGGCSDPGRRAPRGCQDLPSDRSQEAGSSCFWGRDAEYRPGADGAGTACGLRWLEAEPGRRGQGIFRTSPYTSGRERSASLRAGVCAPRR